MINKLWLWYFSRFCLFLFFPFLSPYLLILCSLLEYGLFVPDVIPNCGNSNREFGFMFWPFDDQQLMWRMNSYRYLWAIGREPKENSLLIFLFVVCILDKFEVKPIKNFMPMRKENSTLISGLMAFCVLVVLWNCRTEATSSLCIYRSVSKNH